jgi:hypothetical protein
MPPKRFSKRLSGFASRVDPGRILAGVTTTSSGGSAPLEQEAAIRNRSDRILEAEAEAEPSHGNTDQVTAFESLGAAPSAPAPSLPLADRTDRPALAYTKRGSYALVVSHAATAETRAKAPADLEDGFYANSSKRPRASYVRTWEGLHRAWFGDTEPVLPITSKKLKAVGALFKAGKREESRIP